MGPGLLCHSQVARSSSFWCREVCLEEQEGIIDLFGYSCIVYSDYCSCLLGRERDREIYQVLLLFQYNYFMCKVSFMLKGFVLKYINEECRK